jgi:group I intron endonuclease
MKLTHVIYKLTFPNSKVYIGQTCNMVKRMSNYKQESVNRNSAVCNAVCKYGWANVTIEIIKRCTPNRADFWERKFIKQFKSTDIKFGYNLESGGHENKILSLEARKKMSDNHHRRGVFGKDNPDSIAVYQIDIATGNIIKEWSSLADIQRELGISTTNISKACSGRVKTARKYIWVYKNSYSKDKVSQLLLNVSSPHGNSRTVLQLSREGEVVREWSSVTEAGSTLRVTVQNIAHVCSNKPDSKGYVRRTAGGFKWKYKNSKNG